MTLDFIKCSRLIGKDPGGFSRCGAQAVCVNSVAVAPGLSSAGSVVAVHGIGCSTARGIFLDQESNPCLLHWQADSSTGPPEKPVLCNFKCSNVHTEKMKISRPGDFTHLFSLTQCFHRIIIPACNPHRLLGRWYTFLVLYCFH